jgi:hypothetical protein
MKTFKTSLLRHTTRRVLQYFWTFSLDELAVEGTISSSVSSSLVHCLMIGLNASKPPISVALSSRKSFNFKSGPEKSTMSVISL